MACVTVYQSRLTLVSSENTAWKWNYNSTALTLSNQKKVVINMANDDHVTRTLLGGWCWLFSLPSPYVLAWNVVSAKHPNYLIVSRGSAANVDTTAATKSSGHGQIRVFDWTNLPSGDTGLDFVSKGSLLAYGVRNEVGIVEDGAGHIWGVENSADDLVRVRGGVSYDVHQNNPGEKLHNCTSPRAAVSFRANVERPLVVGDALSGAGTFFGYPCTSPCFFRLTVD